MLTSVSVRVLGAVFHRIDERIIIFQECSLHVDDVDREEQQGAVDDVDCCQFHSEQKFRILDAQHVWKLHTEERPEET